MDIYQFSLFFAALVIAYILVHIRLLKFEEYLKEIGTLRQLNDRLKDLADGMERIRVDRVEEGLQRLHEDLRDLQDITGNLELRVNTPAPVAIDAGPLITPRGSPSERIRAVVEERLLSLGYGNLRILTDLSDASLDEEFDVQVECERRHMPYKGRVKTQNGAVRDVQVHSVVQSFP